MSILVTGSVAVDYIMVFGGRFRDIILPDKIHMLNVAFHVPTLRKTYGGCAANIAFCLRRLGGEPLVAATVGNDFGSYAGWLDEQGIRRDYIRELADEATAGAYITTDLDDNQIIGFHPGAMDRAHEVRLEEIVEAFDFGIVSPNGKQAMIDYARGLKKRGVHTVIDPGQGLPLFDRAELTELLTDASTYVVNDYEWEMTQKTTELSEEEIASRVSTLIVTLGEKGARIRSGNETFEIPSVKADRVVDPTGCGDSFRAGYLFALEKGLPLETAGRLGSVMGSFMVERAGTQTIDADLAAIRTRYEKAFGTPPF
ncbi:MAG: carbohydrate kinase family protein [Myxococcales bacterium]|nr:carbohydrate kinase family protein [Myxococcales bacterium]